MIPAWEREESTQTAHQHQIQREEERSCSKLFPVLLKMQFKDIAYLKLLMRRERDIQDLNSNKDTSFNKIVQLTIFKSSLDIHMYNCII